MYNGYKVTHVVARDQVTHCIGNNNQLMWRVPEDMIHFKNNTIGKVCLMGTNTYKSVNGFLRGRIIKPVGTTYDTNLIEALDNAVKIYNESELPLSDDKSIMICGGTQLYNSTFDITDTLIVTEIECYENNQLLSYNGDSYYEIPDGQFELIAKTKVKVSKQAYDSNKHHNYIFSVYNRKVV